MSDNTTSPQALSVRGLIVGLIVFAIPQIVPSPFEGLSTEAWKMLGIAMMMATWWTSEALPIPATALAPLVLAPLLGIAKIGDVASSYAHPLIFLFLGGFMLSLAMEKCHLHRRIALLTLRASGSQPKKQVAGIMLITAFLSMWMSNTATAVMMLPIALSIIDLVNSQQKNQHSKSFAIALLLAIAYSASIGGVATLIGTPPNALLAAYLSDNYQIQIGFAQWMLMGLPVSIVMLIFCWFWLTRWGFKLPAENTQGTRQLLDQQLAEMGPMSRAEKHVASIFIFTAVCWMFRPILANITGLAIDDTGIVIFSALLLFMIPSKDAPNDYLLNWENTRKLPWGVLLLFGGGLSLAGMISSTGLANFIAGEVSANANLSSIVLIFLITAIIVFLTEITSNTATTAGFLPLLGPISMSISDNPLTLTIPAAIAASCAFMMPVATPPNSVVFASGEVTIRDMMKAGFVLNIFSILFIASICILIAEPIFN